MRLSDERILFLAREALVRLRDEKLAEIPNFSLAFRQARELIAAWAARGDALDAEVRRRIASLKRGVVEGSAEWTVLYRRYREELARRKGPAG